MLKDLILSFINKKTLGMYVKKIKKIPLIVGRNAFLFILIFILIDILLGELLLYQYIFAVKVDEPKMVTTDTTFKEGVYQSVLRELE